MLDSQVAPINPERAPETQIIKEIHIQTCTNCRSHSFTSWHQEERYISCFEKVKKAIQEKNPDIKVIRVTGRKVPRGAFEIMHGDRVIFSKILVGQWPGPNVMKDLIANYFDDLAHGRDVSQYGKISKKPAKPQQKSQASSPTSKQRSQKPPKKLANQESSPTGTQSTQLSQISSPELRSPNFDTSGMESALTIKLIQPLLIDNPETVEKLEAEKRENEQEERNIQELERKNREMLKIEEQKKKKGKAVKQQNFIEKRKINIPKDKIAVSLLRELTDCLDKSITTPLEIDGQTLIEFINLHRLLLDSETYAEPWELSMKDAKWVKDPLIVVLYRYFEFLKFPKELAQLDFDISDLRNGFKPLGIALAGGLNLTTCFIDDTTIETNESSHTYPAFSVLRNTVTHLIKLADKTNFKLTPDIRVGNDVYNNLYDIFLRYIFSPIPYNQTHAELPTHEIMHIIKEECSKILEMLDLSQVDQEDLAVSAFNDSDTFSQLEALVINPKEFYGAKGMHKDFIETLMSEYSNSKLETSFWSSSNILAFAGSRFLSGILDILKSKGLKYSPCKRNPVSGAYAFVWNAGPMEISDLSYIIDIGKVSGETLNLEQTDEFGFSLLNYTQILVHKEGLLDFLKEKGFNFDIKAYHPYHKVSMKRGKAKEMHDYLFRWTKRVSNKAKWRIRHVTLAQDSYFYKIILQELAQINNLERLDQFDISPRLLAHIAREICCWKGSTYEEEILKERVDRIHKLLTYLDKRENEEKNKASDSNSSGSHQKQLIINLKMFYEGSKGCDCKAVPDKIQNLQIDQDTLSQLFLSITDKLTTELTHQKQQDSQVENLESLSQPIAYAEIALLIYLSLDKKAWSTNYEIYRCNSLWAGFCSSCFQRYKSSLPKDKMLKVLPKRAKEQVLSQLLANSISNEEKSKKYLEYAKNSGLKINNRTEFRGKNILEQVLKLKNSDIQNLMKEYIRDKNITLELQNKNSHGDTLLDTFRDDEQALNELNKIVEDHSDLFCSGAEGTRHRCELLRRIKKYKEALKILDSKKPKEKEEDLETLCLRAKIHESEGESAKASEVYGEIIDKHESAGLSQVALLKTVAKHQTHKTDEERREAIYQLTNVPNNTNDYTQVMIEFNKLDLALKLEDTGEALNIIVNEFPKLEKIDLEQKLGKKKANFFKQVFSTFKKAKLLSPTKKLKEKESRIPDGRVVTQFVYQVVTCMNKDINADDIEKLQKGLHDAQAQINEMNDVLKASGMKEDAESRAEFERLRTSNDENDKERFKYVITFYWTLQNYLESERVMSTGMLSVDKESFQKQTYQKSNLKTVISKLTSKVSDALEAVPMFGGFAKLVNCGVEMYFDEVDSKNQNDHVHAINNVLKYYPGPIIQTQDITKHAARAALAIIKGKSMQELKPKKDESVLAKLTGFMDEMKEKVIGKEIELYDGDPALRAYQDVIAVILYMAKEYEKIIKDKEAPPFGDRIARIILNKEYEKVLEKSKRGKGKSQCCEMF